jgi:hypothetical protein
VLAVDSLFPAPGRRELLPYHNSFESDVKNDGSCSKRAGSQTERDLAPDLLGNSAFYKTASRTDCVHIPSPDALAEQEQMLTMLTISLWL